MPMPGGRKSPDDGSLTAGASQLKHLISRLIVNHRNDLVQELPHLFTTYKGRERELYDNVCMWTLSENIFNSFTETTYKFQPPNGTIKWARTHICDETGVFRLVPKGPPAGTTTGNVGWTTPGTKSPGHKSPGHKSPGSRHQSPAAKASGRTHKGAPMSDPPSYPPGMAKPPAEQAWTPNPSQDIRQKTAAALSIRGSASRKSTPPHKGGAGLKPAARQGTAAAPFLVGDEEDDTPDPNAAGSNDAREIRVPNEPQRTHSWERLEQLSKPLVIYLRHGARKELADKWNLHDPAGWVLIKDLLRVPLFRPAGMDVSVDLLAAFCKTSDRVELNGRRNAIRALSKHTLDVIDPAQAYERVTNNQHWNRLAMNEKPGNTFGAPKWLAVELPNNKVTRWATDKVLHHNRGDRFSFATTVYASDQKPDKNFHGPMDIGYIKVTELLNAQFPIYVTKDEMVLWEANMPLEFLKSVRQYPRGNTIDLVLLSNNPGDPRDPPRSPATGAAAYDPDALNVGGNWERPKAKSSAARKTNNFADKMKDYCYNKVEKAIIRDQWKTLPCDNNPCKYEAKGECTFRHKGESEARLDKIRREVKEQVLARTVGANVKIPKDVSDILNSGKRTRDLIQLDDEDIEMDRKSKSPRRSRSRSESSNDDEPPPREGDFLAPDHSDSDGEPAREGDKVEA